MGDKTLQSTEQQEVPFYDDMITAVRVEDGTVYVPIKPICDTMGLNWSGQRQRINRDAIFAEVAMSVCVTHSDIDPSSRRPRTSDMLALPLEFVNGWLVGINVKRVKPEIKEPLRRYQLECYRVLYEAFSLSTVTARHDEQLMQSTSDSAIAYRNALAIAKIARQQFYLEKRMDESRIQIGRLDERLSLVEANLSKPDAVLSQEQAEQVAGAVKLIAGELGDKSGRNEYGRVYRELYREFAITSYKLLPTVKFEKAMDWLRGWWSDVSADDDCPF